MYTFFVSDGKKLKKRQMHSFCSTFIPTKLPQRQDSVFWTMSTSVTHLNGFFYVCFCSLVSGLSYSAMRCLPVPLRVTESHSAGLVKGPLISSMLWKQYDALQDAFCLLFLVQQRILMSYVCMYYNTLFAKQWWVMKNILPTCLMEPILRDKGKSWLRKTSYSLEILNQGRI